MCVASLLKTKYALCELRSLLDGPCEYDREAGSSVRPESVLGSLRSAGAVGAAGLAVSVSRVDGAGMTGGGVDEPLREMSSGGRAGVLGMMRLAPPVDGA